MCLKKMTYMKQRLILVMAILITRLVVGQSYEFINEVLGNNKGKIYLENSFSNFLPNLSSDILTERFLREQWEPIKSNTVPDIEPFLKGIRLEDLRSFIEISDIGTLDCKKLGRKIKLIKDVEKYLEKDKSVCRISRPFINENKQWAIIYQTCYSQFGGGSGNLCIYRKINGKWMYYHNISIHT